MFRVDLLCFLHIDKCPIGTKHVNEHENFYLNSTRAEKNEKNNYKYLQIFVGKSILVTDFNVIVLRFVQYDIIAKNSFVCSWKRILVKKHDLLYMVRYLRQHARSNKA